MPFFAEHEIHPFFIRNPAARKRFIGLVGCSNKSIREEPCKARDMYRGALARSSLRWVDRNCERFFIVSPKHHLLEPDQIIEPYKNRMKDMPEEDLIAWAQVITIQLKEKVGFKTPFVLLGGAEYANALNLPKRYRIYKEFKFYDPCPLTMMGMRLHWLRTHPVMSREVVKEIKNGKTVAPLPPNASRV